MVRVATSKLAKLGVVVPIPILPFGPMVMEPIVEVPLRPVTEIVPPTVKLEEAFKTPLTKRLALMVEEAVERKPVKVERPSTFKVEEAEEINPPPWIASPLIVRVLEADKGPVTFKELEIVEEPLIIKPPKSVNLAASLSSPLFRVEKIRIP